MKTLSVAEAKNTLPAVIHEAEEGEDIGITRYGQAVAVLVSLGRYEALAAKPHGFRDALHTFLAEDPATQETALRDDEDDSWRDRSVPPKQSVFL